MTTIHWRQVEKIKPTRKWQTAVKRQSHAGQTTQCTCPILSQCSMNLYVKDMLEVFYTKRDLPANPLKPAKLKTTAMANRNYHFGSGISSSQTEFSVTPHFCCLGPSYPGMTWALNTVMFCSEEAERTHQLAMAYW